MRAFWVKAVVGISSMSNKKQIVFSEVNDLIVGLKAQRRLMIENAERMKKLLPNGNHIELLGAADITQNWIEALTK